MQIWCSTGCHSNRPATGDVLIGSVYIHLADLLTSKGTLRCVITSHPSYYELCVFYLPFSGWYPVYKVGADDFGQQALYLSLSLSPSQEEGEPGKVELLVGV